jgi:hypothetical protein
VPDAPTPLGAGAVDLSLISAVERLGISVPITPTVGVAGTVSGQVATGIDGESALYAGARAGWDWELGVPIEVWRTRSMLLGVQVGAWGSRGLQVEPVAVLVEAGEIADDAADSDEGEDLVDDARATPAALSDALVDTERAWGGQASVSAAWKLHHSTGLIVGLRFRGGRGEAGDTRGTPITASIGASVDVQPWQKLPAIGKIEYRFRSLSDAAGDAEAPLEDRVERRHYAGLGAFWRTRHEAELGVSAWSLLSRTTTTTEQLLAAEAVIRVFY